MCAIIALTGADDMQTTSAGRSGRSGRLASSQTVRQAAAKVSPDVHTIALQSCKLTNSFGQQFCVLVLVRHLYLVLVPGPKRFDRSQATGS